MQQQQSCCCVTVIKWYWCAAWNESNAWKYRDIWLHCKLLSLCE